MGHQVSEEGEGAGAGLRVGFLLQEARALYGAERVTLSLMKALRGQGVDAVALVMDETRLGAQRRLAAAAEEGGLPVVRLPVDRAFSWSLVSGLRRVARERGLQMLHVTGHKGQVHASSARACPVVATVHGWLFRREWKERFYGWMEQRLLARDAAVICLSRFYEDLLLRRGVRRERLHRIPGGLEPGELPSADRTGLPPGPLVVGILGRLSSEKNHAMFLRAARRLVAGGVPVRFVVAGDGPDRAALERTIRDGGLSAQVELAGYRPSDEFFASVHVLAHCSRVENLPRSILEAMAWSRPVCATRVGGIPDLVVPGETGALVDSDDDAALADVLSGLAADRERVQRWGRAGRERVEREFTLARGVAQHLEVYRAVAASARGGNA